MRSIRALALAAVALPLFAGEALAARILLTNDDGYDAPGIVALQAALTKAGHDVTVVAPAANRSGSSTAITTAPFAVKKISDKVYSVDGTPATTVLYGVSVVFKDAAPDLIVSGTNAGANVGASTVLSGTVGNTIAAMTQFAPSIPSIAFSADLLDADPTSAANQKQFATVASYGVKMVARLLKAEPKLGKVGRFALNVNWPGVTADKIAGVRYAVQGRAITFSWGFREVAPGTWAISPSAAPAQKDVARSDSALLAKKFVTISVLDGDYTAPAAVEAAVSAAVGRPAR